MENRVIHLSNLIRKHEADILTLSAGIEAVVDGEEMNSAVFYVYCTENKATIEQALENQGISLEE